MLCLNYVLCSYIIIKRKKKDIEKYIKIYKKYISISFSCEIII